MNPGLRRILINCSTNLNFFKGDLIGTATDGLFDNVPDEVLLQELSYLPHADQIHTQGLPPPFSFNPFNSPPSDLERTAKCLASRAHKNALNKSYVSPFALAAKSAGFHYTGGKIAGRRNGESGTKSKKMKRKKRRNSTKTKKMAKRRASRKRGLFCSTSRA